MFSEALIEKAARAGHEINRAWQNELGEFPSPPWEAAPPDQKESCRAGVLAIAEAPGISPEQQHECWLKGKKKDGWTFGEKKDPEKKEHPCFVPYDELPVEQRAKDYLFGTVVRAMLDLPLLGEVLDADEPTDPQRPLPKGQVGQ